ncbi:hypothetical protein OFN12_32895, partial [Escherichia coli]|nr:hypothetical protein [Escherichia coli]
STGADFEGLVVVTGRLLLETGPELVLLAVLLPDSACCIPNQIKPAIPPPPQSKTKMAKMPIIQTQLLEERFCGIAY